MARFLFLALFLALFTLPARAELTFCNQSGQQASIAIGYKGDQDWTSEGWWTVASGDCTVAVAGDLPLGHYYWRATTPEGAFKAEDYYFCTSSKVFTIVGDTECEARGYRREAFSEIEVPGASATVTLTAATAPKPAAQNAAPPVQEAYDYGAIQQALQGVWHDTGDDAFTTIIRGNLIEDRFLGVVTGNGHFDLVATCDGADGAGPVMLVTYEEFNDETLCWVIQKLDDREWQFKAIGGTKPVRFRKGV